MPSVIQTQPDHARLIGVITAEWSLVEMMLSSVFGALLGVEHSRAHAVFFALHSHRAQFDVVRAAATVALREHPGKQADLEQILDRIKTVAKRRNKLAHSLWGVSPTTGAVRLINIRKPRHEVHDVSPDDLQAVADEIASIVKDLHRLYARLAGFEDLLETKG